MKYIILDCENTVQILEDGVKDNSPFNPKNKLVSAHWKMYDSDTKQETPIQTRIFFHNEQSTPDLPDDLAKDLELAYCMVAHNAKYDYLWLKSCGFNLPDKVYCTMIGEYIQSRGVKRPLSLEATAIRRHVTHKKSDLTKEYWDNGIGFEAMPLEIVIEYAEGDVQSCFEIFLQQIEEFADQNKTRKLGQIVSLMNDMLLFLVEIESNGVYIDLEQLDKVRIEYEKEKQTIITEMNTIISEVMGDTPINLNSGADVCKVIYSREVVDRDLHKELFNIGIDEFGKEQYPPRLSQTQFANYVRKTTRKVYKTIAKQCPDCNGKGYIQKYNKDGKAAKRLNVCHTCEKTGVVYENTKEIAGFKLIPNDATFASIHGFKADKAVLGILLEQARSKGYDRATTFIKHVMRLNAVNTYLDSFVVGINRWTRYNNILHPTFNQTRTATGRLSSSDPNFQNQPKGKKFPVRAAIKSRFDGGGIIEADFSGLEFVVAGELSRDEQIIEDVTNGKDVHSQTASIVLQKPKEEVSKDERGASKPDTFAPLYGATGADKPHHIKRYYQEFFNIYKRHGEWQHEMMDHVINEGYIQTPSGREYVFPGTVRYRNGRVSNGTKIVNYPVQGFATGDIVPLACIRALRIFKKMGLKSLLILQVHDSIVVDYFPGEEQAVKQALTDAMTGCPIEIKTLWDYDMVLPLKIEVSIGEDWMNTEVFA